MAGNTYYSTGTASVSNGGTTVTGSGTAWASVVQAGDLFIVPAQGLVAMITAVASNTSITIDAWPGTTISGAAYKIVFASDAIRQSERARRYAEIASQIENTGIGIDAFGDFVDRDAYDTQVAGYAFLSFDGDGDTITEPVIFIKNSSTSADWSAAVEIVGPQGAQGETGLIGVWEGPWLTATAYAVGDAVSQGGSSYICVEAHTSGTFSTDLAASKWELVAAKGDTGATGTNGTDGIDGTGLFSRVRAVAASNITIATALNDGDTLDGVTLATNDLVLVAGQSAPAENGVYVVGVSPARDSSFDTYDEHPGVYVSVMEGTSKADTLWRCTSDKGGTLGTTALTFTEFSGTLPDTSVGAALRDATNLIVKYVSATSVDIDADRLVLRDSSGSAKVFNAVDLTAAITTAGANGLDTGTEASNTWYYVWAVGKSDGTIAALLSASATSPTLPSGYTFKGRLAAARNDASSNFKKFLQRGRKVSISQDDNSVLSFGTATTLTSVSLSAAVPPNAVEFDAGALLSTTSGTSVGGIQLSTGGSGTTPDRDLREVQIASLGASSWTLPIVGVPIATAQTTYYCVFGTNVQGSLRVCGWSF